MYDGEAPEALSLLVAIVLYKSPKYSKPCGIAARVREPSLLQQRPTSGSPTSLIKSTLGNAYQ
jgi:hypothetical protein